MNEERSGLGGKTHRREDVTLNGGVELCFGRPVLICFL